MVPLHSGLGEVQVLVVLSDSEIVTFSLSMDVLYPLDCLTLMVCGAFEVLGLGSLSQMGAVIKIVGSFDLGTSSTTSCFIKDSFRLLTNASISEARDSMSLVAR